MSTSATLDLLFENEEDFEWYPTTSEIIQAVVKDILSFLREDRYRAGDYKYGIIDVGAGDGRVLKRVHECIDKATDRHINMFAIEKAITHLNNLPKDILVIGTDLMEQSLVDKHMTFMFCNPPYSEFERWAVKLIRECACERMYLVIPQRWKDSVEIKQALSLRNTEAEVLGSFDFENADRRARCKVNILAIQFAGKSCAFDTAIEEMFPELEAFNRDKNLPEDEDDERACEVVEYSENMIQTLVESYDREIATMLENYRGVSKIHPAILAELGISKANILDGISSKIRGLKDVYWKKLFDYFKPITKRLATKQRAEFLSSLGGKGVIDFTESNIFSIMIWITKWANDHFDTQLIEMFRRLSDFANVVNYKSNEKVWTKNNWRYYELQPECRRDDVDEVRESQYKLEYRMVLEHCGGINTSPYSWEAVNGLDKRGFDFLSDCVTVANNLGFECDDSPANYQWWSNKKNEIKLKNGETLIAVRAFQNKNMHVHWNPKVMLAINVEAGRLLGWVRNPEQASKEMGATKEEAAEIKRIFGSSLRLSSKNLLAIGCSNG